MRNLLEYPVTREEVIQCLERAATEAAKSDEMSMRLGNLDTFILKSAATLVATVGQEHFEAAFHIPKED